MPPRRPSSDTLLRTTPAREVAVRIMAVVSFALGLGYLVWRATGTLNPEAPIMSVALLGAEAWTILTAGLLFLAAWNPFSRGEPPPAPPGKTVDVFVPTLNEPVWVVRRTLIGAVAIDYPHRTWLLDDGNRPEMAALAAELGVGYLPRESSEGAKAGHLNYALERTDGEFVVLFDADHIATAEFLDRTLGWFEDEDVAFVQTPQEFYNLDSFEHDLDQRRRAAWHEQLIFYRLIQPGKDHWNAAFFCGSNAVLRRAAIEDAGGFPTETITEDIHLSILVHARGWRSVFHREVLAYGLAPQTAEAFHTQRLRWGQGGMQVLRKANPLTLPGLSFLQRVNYLASLLPWFDGWQKVIFYSIPPLFLLTGNLPLRADALQFAVAFLATYGSLLVAAKLAARGAAKFLLADAYRATVFPVNIKATLGLFVRRRLKFAVTDKEGKGRLPVRATAPQLAFVALTVSALAVGAWRLGTGQEPYVLAFWVAVFWASLNLGVLGWAVWQMLGHAERRALHRTPAHLPVWWEGAVGGLGLLEDVNETGGRLRVQGPLIGDSFRIRLWPADFQWVEGTVQWRRREGGDTVAGLTWTTAGVPGGDPYHVAALAVLFAQRRYLQHVDIANRAPGNGNGHRNGHEAPAGWRPERLEAAVPVRVLGDEAWGLLFETGDRAVAVLLAPPEAARVRLAPWDAGQVWRGTVRSIRRVEFGPFPVFEVALDRLVRNGRRVPGLDAAPATAAPIMQPRTARRRLVRR